jgi:hypothetical protein
MANDALGFPFGRFTNDNQPQDAKYFNRFTKLPYVNVAEVMSVLPIGVRVAGLEVNIAGIEYWFPANETDLSLPPVVKVGGIEIKDDTIALDSTYSSKKIESDFLTNAFKFPISEGYTTENAAEITYPKGAYYSGSYSNSSGLKVTGVLQIKLPHTFFDNRVVDISGRITRSSSPAETIDFFVGGYFSGDTTHNWWNIKPAKWKRDLIDLPDIPVRFGYILDGIDLHPVIEIGTISTIWSGVCSFVITGVTVTNDPTSDAQLKGMKSNWVVSVVDIALPNGQSNLSTIMLVPTQPISFVDKVLSGCDLVFSVSNTKVSVNTGYYDIAGTQYNPPAMGTPFNIPTPNATYPRRDVITGTQNLISANDSYFKYYIGTPSETATLPTIGANEVIIRDLLVSTGGVQPSPPDLSGYAKLNGGNNFSGDQTTNLAIRASQVHITKYGDNTTNQYSFLWFDRLHDGNLSFVAIDNSGGFFDVYTVNRLNKILDFKVRPTLNGSQLALLSEVGTKENTANKSNDVADVASTIKFPVWTAVVSYLTSVLNSFKTANFLDATSSIQGQINGKEPALPTGGTSSQYFAGDKTLKDFATAAETQTQTTPATQAGKMITLFSLIYWFNWLKTQVVNISSTWSFTKLLAGTSTVKNAHLTIAAPTSTIATEHSDWGIAYTGTEIGAEWKETTDFRKKINRNGVTDEYLFKGVNKALEGAGVAIAFLGADGTIQRGATVEEAYTLDTDVITAITSATYTTNYAVITPANSKIFRQGDEYFDSTSKFLYKAIADNQVKRMQ